MLFRFLASPERALPRRLGDVKAASWYFVAGNGLGSMHKKAKPSNFKTLDGELLAHAGLPIINLHGFALKVASST